MVKNKLILIHVPRTAGTSLSRFLRFYYSKSEQMNTKKRPFGAEWMFARITDEAPVRPVNERPLVTGHHAIHQFDVAELKKDGWKFLTAVREPWERFISHYLWVRWSYIRKLRPEWKKKAEKWSILDWAKAMENHMWHYCGENPGIFDYMVRQTDYDEDTKFICSELGLEWKDDPEIYKGTGFRVDGRTKASRHYDRVPKIHWKTKEKIKNVYLAKDYEFYHEALKRWEI